MYIIRLEVETVRGKTLAVFFYGGTSSMEKIINEKVDNLLVEMEGYFKEAVEKNKVAQDELDKKVKALIDEHDAKEEVVRFTKVKDLSDYMALTISMPLEEETKEKVIEELVKECRDGGKTKEGV